MVISKFMCLKPNSWFLSVYMLSFSSLTCLCSGCSIYGWSGPPTSSPPLMYFGTKRVSLTTTQPPHPTSSHNVFLPHGLVFAVPPLLLSFWSPLQITLVESSSPTSLSKQLSQPWSLSLCSVSQNLSLLDVMLYVFFFLKKYFETMQLRLVLNSQFFYFSYLSAGITGVHLLAWLFSFLILSSFHLTECFKNGGTWFCFLLKPQCLAQYRHSVYIYWQYWGLNS